MTGLYVLIKYLTFPGALVRGFWEQVVCRCCKVPVEDNRYLRNDEMASHIEHEFMPTARGAFAICFVPCLFNLVGAFLMGLIPSVMVLYLKFSGLALTLCSAVSYWFALSLFVNAFPLVEDALHMKDKVYHSGNILQKIFYTPGLFITFGGAFLEKYCLTFLAAVIFTVVLLVK